MHADEISRPSRPRDAGLGLVAEPLNAIIIVSDLEEDGCVWWFTKAVAVSTVLAIVMSVELTSGQNPSALLRRVPDDRWIDERKLSRSAQVISESFRPPIQNTSEEAALAEEI